MNRTRQFLGATAGIVCSVTLLAGCNRDTDASSGSTGSRSPDMGSKNTRPSGSSGTSPGAMPGAMPDAGTPGLPSSTASAASSAGR